LRASAGRTGFDEYAGRASIVDVAPVAARGEQVRELGANIPLKQKSVWLVPGNQFGQGQGTNTATNTVYTPFTGKGIGLRFDPGDNHPPRKLKRLARIAVFPCKTLMAFH
jgi:hypothetical protein